MKLSRVFLAIIALSFAFQSTYSVEQQQTWQQRAWSWTAKTFENARSHVNNAFSALWDRIQQNPGTAAAAAALVSIACGAVIFKKPMGEMCKNIEWGDKPEGKLTTPATPPEPSAPITIPPAAPATSTTVTKKDDAVTQPTVSITQTVIPQAASRQPEEFLPYEPTQPSSAASAATTPVDQPKISQTPSIPQERRIPPLGMSDTLLGEGISAHGSGELFSDDEILEKLDIIRHVKIPGKYISIDATFTKNGKAIIQQQATRGCTAATAAMLIMDNGKMPQVSCLTGRNMGTNEAQVRDIQNAGLTAAINSANNLSDLRGLILKNGPAIVTLSGKLGGHVVVVDDVSGDLSRIRLRDPYHGWEITVGSESFLKEWRGGDVIQVVKG